MELITGYMGLASFTAIIYFASMNQLLLTVISVMALIFFAYLYKHFIDL